MNILIVDDDEQNCYQLQVLLGGASHQVVAAANGAEALDMARQNPPDLIVSDILMPVMDGFALCREWLKDERLRLIPFVFYTATYTDEHDREFALSLGAARFIVKPVEPGVFFQTILDVLHEDRSSVPPMASALLPENEACYLRQYNATLIRKLERKMRQVEEAKRALEHEFAESKQASEEKEKLEVQLNQSQKMDAVGRLAGGVAHDFNNMLGVILGYSEMALEHLQSPVQLREDIQEIINAGQSSAALTRQLLAFARKQIIAPKILDINDTISGMLKMLGRLIGEDIDLQWKPADHLWPLMIDPSQIDQILANLVVNARDAISGGGQIAIETANARLDEEYVEIHPDFLPGRYVLLAVSDDGCGMDKETQAHIFEPFFTTKSQGQGTGLGLATVYGIVKQNHGFINVYSEPGKGTKFNIYLPRHGTTAETACELDASAVAPTGTETVLLVEDDAALLKLTQTMLEKLGYAVLAAESPGQAIQLAKERGDEIHLLLSDVVIPNMSGAELQKKLNALRPGLKCLFMSGYTAEVIAHHGVLEQGVHFLPKPFSKKDLALKLREVLDDEK